MTVDSNTFQITVKRGDTGFITVNFTGTTTGATALISLKKETDDTSVLWEKKLSITDNVVNFYLSSDDTDYDFGTYYWDLRVLFSGGTIETPMDPAKFVITEVVGNV